MEFLKRIFRFRGLKIGNKDKATLPLETFLISMPYLIFWSFFFFKTRLFQSLAVWLFFGISLAIYALGVYVVFNALEYFSFFRVLKYRRILRFYLEENNFVREIRGKGKDAGVKKKYTKTHFSYKDRFYYVTFILRGNRFQQRLLKIAGDLEISFGLDMVEIIDESDSVTYVFTSGLLQNVYKSNEVVADVKNGLMLMKDIVWDFISNPHLLIAGGTGGGKTVLMRSILVGLLKIGIVDILDPKQADFVSLNNLPVLKDRIYYETIEMGKHLIRVNKFMDKRYAYMRKKSKEKGEKQLESFYTYGLKPYFIMIDEFPSLMSALADELGYKFGAKERPEISEIDVLSAFKQITLKGRQAGIFFIIATQNVKNDDLPTTIRDNVMCRITVGRLSDTTYNILFPDSNKKFKYIKKVDGRRVYGMGYFANNGETPRQFLSPQMPSSKSFTFWDSYEKLPRLELENNDTPIKYYNQKEFASELKLSARTLRTILTEFKGTDYEFGEQFKDSDFAIFEKVISLKEQESLSYRGAVSKILDEVYTAVED
ncbi:hypothetical protein RyT2_07750 [Pseudolactococcus yaeyamensis]